MLLWVCILRACGRCFHQPLHLQRALASAGWPGACHVASNILYPTSMSSTSEYCWVGTSCYTMRPGDAQWESALPVMQEHDDLSSVLFQSLGSTYPEGVHCAQCTATVGMTMHASSSMARHGMNTAA